MKIFINSFSSALIISMVVDSSGYGFQCLNGTQMISRTLFCDSFKECRDGSDEILYNSSIHTEEDGIPCRSLIYLKRVCLLPKNMTHLQKTLCRKDDNCAKDEMKCLDGTRCFYKYLFCRSTLNTCNTVPYNSSYHTDDDGISCPVQDSKYNCLLGNDYVCDGKFHCLDKSDECNCNESKFICDKSADCPHGTDECFCGKGIHQHALFSNYKCFRCLDRSKIIPASQLCDGIVQCKDLSDECLCQTKKKDKLLKICSRICWGESCVCPGRLYCPASDQAEDGCLQKKSICDYNFDCLSKLDEEYCEAKQICSDGKNSTGKDCDTTCYNMRRAKSCDGIVDCEFGSDECLSCGNSTPGFCKYFYSTNNFRCINGRFLFSHQICDGTPDCNKSYPWISEDEIYCHQTRFYCSAHYIRRWDDLLSSYKAVSVMHIPLSKKCDLVSDCEDASDELDCNARPRCIENGTNCTNTHFYCDDGGGTKYISQDQVCDGNQDCYFARDECQMCADGVFSSDQAMISSIPLIPFLAIISIVALFGNLIVLGHATTALVKNFRKMSLNERNQNSMVLNLAMADLFVGIYTTAISIENALLSYRGMYCFEDHKWRSSNMCSGLGALLLIGSEQSVFTLTIITAFRLKAVCWPFSRTKMRTVWFCMCLTWFLSIILATIPLSRFTEDFFVESIWYEMNSFVTKVEREYVYGLTSKLITMQNISAESVNNIGPLGSWRLIIALIKNLNPGYVPAREFGYYSSHGVCLPRLFPDPRNDAAWGFSLLFILINFFSFIFIFVGYIIIFRVATNTNMEGQANRAATMQKKVTRIVITDFLCWMPICIMAFMQLFGVNISKEVYVPVGTILIPINSALNPFLYSNAPEWLWKKILPLRTSISRGTAYVCNFIRLTNPVERIRNSLENTIHHTRDTSVEFGVRSTEEL